MIKNVTLVAVSSIKLEPTLFALIHSNRYLYFDRVLFLTHAKREQFYHVPSYVDMIEIPELKSKDEYSKFMLYEFKNYINTEHCLTVQYDGFVLHPDKWNKEWLQYDYIGAPWPPFYRNRENTNNLVRVGNGGFSLRSNKFINTYTKLNLPLINDGLVGIAEDHQQCCMYHDTFVNNGINFAPVDVAKFFAHENHALTPETTRDIRPFGFHQCRGYIAIDEYERFPYPTFN
jgi:hypothetical protein